MSVPQLWRAQAACCAASKAHTIHDTLHVLSDKTGPRTLPLTPEDFDRPANPVERILQTLGLAKQERACGQRRRRTSRNSLPGLKRTAFLAFGFLLTEARFFLIDFMQVSGVMSG
jgi:hypothetical protein